MEVTLDLKDTGRGSFFIVDNGKQIAEMVVTVSGTNLTVFHTEVDEAYQGKGISGQLLEAMVNYARSKNLKVIPLCVYVLAQFKRHPQQYADVWNQDWHGKR